MPRDFLNDDNQTPTEEAPAGRDFLNDDVPKESLGQAALAAPFRVGEDMYKGLFHFLQNMPQYFQGAKTGIPAAYQTATQHPAQAGKQALAGFAELGQNAFNLPHDLVNYASQRLNLVPEDINKKVQMGRMPDSEAQINATFGAPQTPGEEAFRWGGRNIDNVLAAGGIAKALNPMALTNKNVAKSIIAEGDKQVVAHNKVYDKLWKDADNAGINQVPVDQKLVTDNMDLIKKYKTPREYKSVDKFMSDPTLANAQTAQSDLGNMKRMLEERSRTSSLTGEEKNLYDALSETQNHIEGNMFKDQAGLTNQRLKDRYDKISRSYRDNVVPYKYNADIQAYKNKELVARQLVGRLKEGEFGAKKGAEHPELYRSDALKKALIGIGVGSGALGGGMTMYKYLTGKNE